MASIESAAAHRKGGSNRHPFGAFRLPLAVAISLAEFPAILVVRDWEF